MQYQTDDLRIQELKTLQPPSALLREFPVTKKAAETTLATRNAIHAILAGEDPRLLVVIGPCSIHDPVAALEYAHKLRDERKRFASELVVVMRVYFEKPRTTLGWKGLINDPYLDGSYHIDEGLRIARRLLLQINDLEVPAGVEFLDVISPQYMADLVSWGTIGARTSESQVHRELASGLSCPVGFKNGTDGNVKIAIDAIKTARHPHRFLSVTKSGHSAIVATSGNSDCHIILRGGKEPNYDAASVTETCRQLSAAGLVPKTMIDVSHANSGKDHLRQIAVAHAVGDQIAQNEHRIMGVMVESHLKGGRQDLIPGTKLIYGQSITDACIGWTESVALLETFAAAVRKTAPPAPLSSSATAKVL